MDCTGLQHPPELEWACDGCIGEFDLQKRAETWQWATDHANFMTDDKASLSTSMDIMEEVFGAEDYLYTDKNHPWYIPKSFEQMNKCKAKAEWQKAVAKEYEGIFTAMN